MIVLLGGGVYPYRRSSPFCALDCDVWRCCVLVVMFESACRNLGHHDPRLNAVPPWYETLAE